MGSVAWNSLSIRVSGCTLILSSMPLVMFDGAMSESWVAPASTNLHFFSYYGWILCRNKGEFASTCLRGDSDGFGAISPQQSELKSWIRASHEVWWLEREGGVQCPSPGSNLHPHTCHLVLYSGWILLYKPQQNLRRAQVIERRLE